MISLNDVLWSFVAESQELLEQMNRALQLVKVDPRDEVAIEALFRAAHTLGGSAALLGLRPVVGFSHSLERVLGRAREGQQALDGPRLALVEDAMAHLAGVIDHLDAGGHFQNLPAERLAGEARLQRRFAETLDEATAGPA